MVPLAWYWTLMSTTASASTSTSLQAGATLPTDVTPTPPGTASNGGLGCFARYLSLWVALAMVAGTTIGTLWPSVADALARATVAQVSIPVGVLIWVMVYPMALRLDLASLRAVRAHPRALIITTVVN